MLRRLYGPLATVKPWRESGHLLLDLGVGIVTCTLVITLLSLSAGLAVTLVGLPLAALTIRVGHVIGSAERARSRALLDDDPPAPPAYRLSGTPWQKARQAFTDPVGWKGLGYGVVMLPWGIVAFSVTVTVWSVALGAAAFPAYGWAVPDAGPLGADADVPFAVRVVLIAATTLAGLALLAGVPRIVAALAAVDRRLVRSMLSPGPEQVLARRVTQLEASREASVESAAGELRRIERDLHDGAQQRLVGLAMSLGLARDRLEGSDDPRAAALVAEAHDEAKQAIAELRDLVRGIHPAVLTDRGLDAAVSALAARCPVPVHLDGDVSRRLPTWVESTAYFVVAEALTNVAKHSGATHAGITMADRGDELQVRVTDDGVGGASEDVSSGLRGLRDRVRSVEGVLTITSPPGGPTTIEAVLPCGS